MTSGDTTKSISSQESEAGPSPSSEPNGATDLFGQPLAPARPSRSQASVQAAQAAKARTLCGALDELAKRYARSAASRGLPTPATYGRRYGDSPRNADLDRSWVSRLREALRLPGSPLYRHRLKSSATPLGRVVYQLRSSALPTSDSGYGGWRTPQADGDRGAHVTIHARSQLNLNSQVAGWASPTARDGRSEIGTPEMMRRRQERRQGKPLSKQVLMGWGTPRIGNHGGHGNPDRVDDGKARLEDQVHGTTMGWASPRATDADKNVRSHEGAEAEANNDLGTTASLSRASSETDDESTAPSLLNPAFSLWLMGFPTGWLD